MNTSKLQEYKVGELRIDVKSLQNDVATVKEDIVGIKSDLKNGNSLTIMSAALNIGALIIYALVTKILQ